ncbi:cytochrome P450 4C1-like isoform X2 [Lycorma delicatula]
MNTIIILEWYIITLLVGMLLAFIVYYKWNRRHLELLAAKLPGPETLPVFGNLFYFLGITNEDFIYKIAEVGQEYRKEAVVRYWLGPYLVIGIYKHEHLEATCCNPRVIDKSALFSFFQSRSKGAFTLSGEVWKRQRKTVNKMFLGNVMENYVKVFNEQSLMLVEHLKKKTGLGTFDVSHSLMRCTLEVICRTSLGVNMNLIEDNNVTFPEDVSRSSEIILERMYKPWLYPSFIFKMTKTGKEMFRHIDRIHQFTITVIKRRRQILKERKTMHKDTEENGFHNHGNKDEDKFEAAPYIDSFLDCDIEKNVDDHELALEALDVIIGGMDTSAVSDSYVLIMLGIYKNWQDKVHREIDELFGNSDRYVTVDDLGHLTNLEMVIKEVLRLYSAPHTLRLLTEDVKLDKFTLPAGAIIYLSFYLLHRDEDYWSNPHEFYPNHFLPENISSRPKHSFLPFSIGPRGCPGLRYGMASMKVLLTNILRKFKVECDLKFEEMKHKPGLMLELVGGYPIRLIPRQPFIYHDSCND